MANTREIARSSNPVKKVYRLRDCKGLISTCGSERKPKFTFEFSTLHAFALIRGPHMLRRRLTNRVTCSEDRILMMGTLSRVSSEMTSCPRRIAIL